MKKILLYLILIMAVGMAAIVAYVSVGGLLKVFSGAGTLGLLFFSAIEVAKIVATSAMHTYGKKIGVIYKGLLSLGIGIAMLITSIGIYGFLSSTYKETFMKLESVEAQVSLLTKQRDGYQGQLDIVNAEKESINARISELSKGISNNVIQYRDQETGQIITTTSSSTRKTLENQLNSATERLDNVSLKSDELNNKVFELDNQITEVKLGNDSAAELGPLKYLSEVTGKSMDEVMKYFIFLLIVIGDPMAVLMVIVFNKIVHKEEDVEESVNPKKDNWLNKVKNPLIKKEKVKPMVVKGDLISGESLTIDRPYVDPETKKEHPLGITEEEIKENLELQREEKREEPKIEINVVNPVGHTPEPVIEEPKKKIEINVVNPVGHTPEPVIEEPKKKITIDDIKEKRQERERGFSVQVPERKRKHTVDRIGTNKEVRDGNTDTVYFKRRD